VLLSLRGYGGSLSGRTAAAVRNGGQLVSAARDLVCFISALACLTATLTLGAAPSAAQPPKTIPTHGEDDVRIHDGRDVIRAMHARYENRWFERLTIVQEVVFCDADGETTRTETWREILKLPGNVRSNIGNAESGNFEIYTAGTFYIFREGKLAHRLRSIHPVLLLGFDVYVQDPGSTLAALEDSGYRLDLVHRTDLEDRSVYVVGARAGDLESDQFWIDEDRLVLVRVLRKTPSGSMMDIELKGYRALDGGWVATELVFKRDGALAFKENYVEVGVPETVDPSVFEIRTPTAPDR
jgi:hypothetical protein